MATKAFKALEERDVRTVGNLVSSEKYIKDVPNGAKFVKDTNNFTLVELYIGEETGEVLATPLKNDDKKGFLVAAVERRYLGEMISEFYVGENERARVVYLTEGLIFETSAYELHNTVTPDDAKAGLVAYWDTTKEKFVVCGKDEPDFTASVTKFVVREIDQLLSDEEVVRLMVIEDTNLITLP